MYGYSTKPSKFTQSSYLAHHGIKGQKWGVRRFENPDGTLTAAGKLRYGKLAGKAYEKFGTKEGVAGKIGRWATTRYVQGGQGALYRDIRRDAKNNLGKGHSKEELNKEVKSIYKKRYGKNADMMYNMHKDANEEETRHITGKIAKWTLGAPAAVAGGVVGGAIGGVVGGTVGTAIPGIGNAVGIEKGVDWGFDIGSDIAGAVPYWAGRSAARIVGNKLQVGSNRSTFELYKDWRKNALSACDKIRDKKLKDLY